MSINPDKYFTRPNNWLETEIIYEGKAKAEFTSPHGFIEGMGRVEVDEFGSLKVMLEIDRFDCEEILETKYPQADTLMWLLNGRKPSIEGNLTLHATGVNPHNICRSFQLTTDEGKFLAIGKINYRLPVILVFEQFPIVFHITSAVFQSSYNKLPEYWIFPLNNFVSPSLEAIYFPVQRHILDKHPLRIFQPSDISFDLPLEEQRQALFYANQTNCFIPFESGETLGFIERISDYQEQAKRLQNGESRTLITAVTVGNVEKRSVEFNEALNWLPLDYLHMLSLASGNFVSIPWIEFRDKNGDLVRRLHTKQWEGPFGDGHITIDNFSTGGIGWLLSKAPSDLGAELRTAIRLIIKGSQSAYYLEDQLAFLFRAADTLTKHLRTKTTIRTQVKIDEALQTRIKDIVREAGRQIRKIASEQEDSDISELERIAQVVSGAMNKSPRKPDEAYALVLLAKQLGLMDFSILPDEAKWRQIYNKYRNQVIHESYMPSNYPLEEFVPLHIHLQDLLIRIVLKQLNYDGKYRKYIPIKENRSVDWVQTNTSTQELWHDPFSK